MSKTLAKPAKPHPDFPLFPHATRRWAKKVRGKLHYFGPWSDPQAALAKWLGQKDDLLAGRVPRVAGEGLTVRELLNRFLTAKQHLVDTREITQRHWYDLHGTCERIQEQFGLTRLVVDLASDDFEAFRATLAKTRGPSALSNEIQRTRAVFKFAFDNGLVDRPIRYGSSFKKPSKKIMRQTRQARGLQMFEAAEIRKMLDAAGPQLKAMILLGVNCGLGNSDVGQLPIAAVDLRRGWLNYPRPKTAVERRCPLWPQTVKTLKAVLAKRPAPKDPMHAGLMFVTKYGGSWAKDSRDNPIAAETRKLLREVGIVRDGLAFYGLRRTFETVAGETIDQVAVDFIMGHSPHVNDMASVYRQRITDDRLKAVTEHVRKWLFTKPKPKSKSKSTKSIVRNRQRVASR
jgi:integrase